MPQRNLYIIAGCNGAGKTTASFNILPEMLSCREFVNADAIAAALSPFQPEKVAFEAGRIMLRRIDELLHAHVDFAVETTLATRTYRNLIFRAREKGYKITLLYFWLKSPEMAIDRVKSRVEKGGHNIPEPVIRRRYKGGLANLFGIYAEICDVTLIYDNTFFRHELIATNRDLDQLMALNETTMNEIKNTIQEPMHHYFTDHTKKIHEALKASSRKLIEETIRNGSHLVTWEDGGPKRIYADELKRRRDAGLLDLD